MKAIGQGAGMLALIGLVCGCGGGGSSGGGGSTPAVNKAPSFTSASTASVKEGLVAAYQAQAQDPEGSALTYAITGGEDAARFAVAAGSGALSFVAAPDFEAPADANKDNVYLVQIAVSDGQLTATLGIQITVTDDGAFKVKRVATGLTDPRYVAAIPGDRRVFVIEKGGRILLLDPVTGASELFINAANVLDPIGGSPRNAISTDGERGLLGLAASPDFATSGVVYGFITNLAGDIEIRRFSRAANNPNQFAAITVMTIPHPGSNTGYGGWIGFGPDGHLYIATGDGGGASDPAGNAQNRQSRLGKILRAMPNPDPFSGAAPNYSLQPVAGNPFIGSGDPFVYALGFHDPRRASFYAGGLLIGDRGQDLAEEIDLLRSQDAGGNYGWPFREGTFAAGGTAPAGLINPVAQYGRTAGLGTSVVGGYVYRGPATLLVGQYVFGDSASGNIWTIPASSLQQGQTVNAESFTRRNAELVPDAGQIDRLVSFGEDTAGNLYIVDTDGEIFAVVPS